MTTLLSPQAPQLDQGQQQDNDAFDFHRKVEAMRNAQPQVAPAPVMPPAITAPGQFAPAHFTPASSHGVELTIVGYRYRPRWNNLVIVVLGLALVGFLAWTMQTMPGDKGAAKAASASAATSGHEDMDHSHATTDASGGGDASSTVELARDHMMKGHFAKVTGMLTAIPEADRDASGATKLMAENNRRRAKFMRLSKDALAHLGNGHWSASIASFTALAKVAPLTPALKRSRNAARHGLHVDRAYDRATQLARAGKYTQALTIARTAQRDYPDSRLVDLIARIQRAAGGTTSGGGRVATAPPATTKSSGGTPPSNSTSRGTKPKKPPVSGGGGGNQNPAPDMGGDDHAGHEHHA